MQPYKIEIYVYAETEEEAARVQRSAINLVKDKYQSGILITADKLANAIDKFKDSYIVNQYFK
jgi:hypothetical protein